MRVKGEPRQRRFKLGLAHLFLYVAGLILIVIACKDGKPWSSRSVDRRGMFASTSPLWPGVVNRGETREAVASILSAGRSGLNDNPLTTTNENPAAG